MSEEEEDDPSIDSQSKGVEESKFTKSNEALESGRAAALAFLKDMNMDDPESNEVGDQQIKGDDKKESTIMQPLASSDDDLQSKSETSTQQQPPSNQSTTDYFNITSRKSHCMTICLVPPPSATNAWEQLTAVRRECKDPGFYRWPPHANIMYPFLEPVLNKDDGKEGKDVQRSRFRNEIAVHLAKAAEQCKPFDVTIDSFGTFGGKQRGVLWAYPKSKYTQACDEEDKEEPLIRLHNLLEDQFPMCKDQRKGGAFNPHMTVSHYENNDNALAAKKEVESRWKPVSFHVPEIYLLERMGDDGQFKIAATIPLGVGSEVELHDPPIAFPAMPEVEEEWVYGERKAMQKRRKEGFKRGKRRGGRSKERGASQESSQKKSP